MSGTNSGRIVPASELMRELRDGRCDDKKRHRYTAAHPIFPGELIKPGFDDLGQLAEYYAGLIDGITFRQDTYRKRFF